MEFFQVRLHIVEGGAGCRFAVEIGAAAVIVDALRASATAAALLFHGATELLVARSVADAFALKEEFPDALLYGERGGLPPPGFDFGNSPQEAVYGRNRRIIFTTTTGAGRLIEAWGAEPLLMGSATNSASVVQYLLNRNAREVVFVPAGLMDAPDFDAREDWAAAACIADSLCASVNACASCDWGGGYDRFLEYRKRIATEGLYSLFLTAPHADKLRAIGKETDIAYCAQTDIYDAAPVAVARHRLCVIVRNIA